MKVKMKRSEANKLTKILANYLPQFHRIPENDKWWGEGFTDWVAMKNARPLFEGHIQPKAPLNGCYDLSDPNTLRWQTELAKSYGIYGFAIYHYWFDSNVKLLEKPAENLLNQPDLDTHYLFIWDNSSWTRTWSQLKRKADWAPVYDPMQDKAEDGILVELMYGNKEDWKIHFDYLLPFFRDERYIKIDNKPVFGFMQAAIVEERPILTEMCEYWNQLAIEAGFAGIYCMGRESHTHNYFPNRFLFGPFTNNRTRNALIRKIKSEYRLKTKGLRIYSYEECWNEELTNARLTEKGTMLHGFVDFDNTPRKGKKGSVVLGATPEKFEHYMAELMKIAREKESPYVFVSAWNEWGENSCLEPDTVHGYAYLEALKRAIDQQAE